jgi:hypothetical protein
MNETRRDGGIRTVLLASSAGTLIEWYDFYIFGSLATVMSEQPSFPKDNPTAALLSTLATFATGFVVRPFGALVFGRVGDMVGRKHAFLVTLLVMGFATTGIWPSPDVGAGRRFGPDAARRLASSSGARHGRGIRRCRDLRRRARPRGTSAASGRRSFRRRRRSVFCFRSA